MPTFKSSSKNSKQGHSNSMSQIFENSPSLDSTHGGKSQSHYHRKRSFSSTSENEDPKEQKNPKKSEKGRKSPKNIQKARKDRFPPKIAINAAEDRRKPPESSHRRKTRARQDSDSLPRDSPRKRLKDKPAEKERQPKKPLKGRTDAPGMKRRGDPRPKRDGKTAKITPPEKGLKNAGRERKTQQTAEEPKSKQKSRRREQEREGGNISDDYAEYMAKIKQVEDDEKDKKTEKLRFFDENGPKKENFAENRAGLLCENSAETAGKKSKKDAKTAKKHSSLDAPSRTAIETIVEVPSMRPIEPRSFDQPNQRTPSGDLENPMEADESPSGCLGEGKESDAVDSLEIVFEKAPKPKHLAFQFKGDRKSNVPTMGNQSKDNSVFSATSPAKEWQEPAANLAGAFPEAAGKSGISPGGKSPPSRQSREELEQAAETTGSSSYPASEPKAAGVREEHAGMSAGGSMALEEVAEEDGKRVVSARGLEGGSGGDVAVKAMPEESVDGPPKPRRNFFEVVEQLTRFNKSLAGKITEETILKMDTEPSSIKIAAEFLRNSENFNYIDIIEGDAEGDYAVLIDNLPPNITLQEVGDFVNSFLQVKFNEKKQLVKDVIFPPCLEGTALILFFSKRELNAAFELKLTHCRGNKLQVSLPSEPLEHYLESPQEILHSTLSRKSNNWDVKPDEKNEVDWRITRDAIINIDISENSSSGFPVVVSNFPYSMSVKSVISYLSNQLDTHFSEETRYVKEVKELSDGAIIIMTQNKEIYNGLLNLKEKIFFENRMLTIRPFIDDGSIKIHKLKTVDVGAI